MRSVRRCAGVLVAAGALLAGQLVASVAARAATGAPPLGQYLACGYTGTAPTPPATCQTLPNALKAALSVDTVRDPATIVLMPGDYCPITIDHPRPPSGDDVIYSPLTIEGGGASASDTTFKWNSAHCGSSAPSSVISVPNYFGDPSSYLQLRDLAVDGGGGPTTGLDIANASVVMRDVLVENSSGNGIYDHPADNRWSFAVYNSALLHNGYGLYCYCVKASILGSTIADNTTGLLVTDNLTLMNDTITHNTTGTDVPNNTSVISTSNTIVGNNISNCSGSSLESGSGGTNLLASGCNPQSARGDITLTDTVGDISSSTKPTPSVTPPNQAKGAGTSGWCNSGDQLEHRQPHPTACDIGAVDTQATTVLPTVSALVEYEATTDRVALGDVPEGETSLGVVQVSNGDADGNPGGGLLTMTGASISGAGLSIYSDACTHIAQLGGASCSVIVGVTPTHLGAVSGTLTVTTNGGTVTVPVGGNGIAALAAPPGTPKVAAGYQHGTVSWTASPSAAVHATPDFSLTYKVEQSTDGGTTWQVLSDQLTQTSLGVALDDGVSYRFRVCSEDFYTTSTAPGPCTSPTAVIKSQPNTSTLSHPASSTVTYGTTMSITTTLTDSTTHAHLAGKPITLWARPGTTGTFAKVTQVATSASGTASASVTPTRTTQYEWRYAGAGIYGPVTSAVWTVSVRPTVAAALRHATVRHGRIAKAYGTVTPSAANQNVTLQYRHAGAWANLGTVKTKLQTLPNHKHVIGFIVTHKFAKARTYSLRIVFPATSALTQAVSKTLILKVT